MAGAGAAGEERRLIPLAREEWPAWLVAAYKESIFPVAAAAEPPEEANEADGVTFFVHEQMYNAVLAKGEPGSIIEQWCFRSLGEALAALILWDGVSLAPHGAPGPQGWIRNFSRRGCWRQDPDTGELWQDAHRKMFAVKGADGHLLWVKPQAAGRELADEAARSLGGVVVELLEHEIDR
jgi:hypothetical protein